METIIQLESRRQGRFENLLRRCRNKVLVHADAWLADLFSSVDEAFLNFADKAESNEIQGRFFDAMKEVGSRRPVVERVFREQVQAAFDDFGQSRRAASGTAASSVVLDGLSLVAHDDVEESVAIDNIIAKVRDANFEGLYALSQRLAVINGGRKLKEREIPAGPHHLAGAFQAAAREVEVDTGIKLILFALFNKILLKQAARIYDELNDELIVAGILPHLKLALQRQVDVDGKEQGGNGASHGPQHQSPDGAAARTESDTAKPQEDAYTQGSTQNLGDELLGSILSLMAMQHGRRDVARYEVPVDSVPTAMVVSAIERIQPDGGTYTSGSGGDIDASTQEDADQVFRAKLGDMLIEERQRLFTQVNRDRMNVADADTIDLVGMLFQAMLDDPGLPNVAKALISRLHTPYLKVVIIDRRLLTEDGHPARCLLDSLVEAGSEWVYEHDINRGIFPAMDLAVSRVLKEFSDNVGLFDVLLADFRIAVEEEVRRAGGIEKRNQEAAIQREKLAIAKQRAVREMGVRARQSCLPRVAAEFLARSWTDKLVFILLRHPHGAELSADWIEALRIADDLVRVFEPKTSVAERRALVKVLCLLRESIEVGLRSLGADQDPCTALFGFLESPELLLAHLERLQKVADQERCPDPRAAQLPQLATRIPATAPASPTRSKEGPPPVPVTVPSWLREMKFGTWFELCDRDSGKPLRLKLSWFSPRTSTCMFVDRFGEQAVVTTLSELAKEIADGRARLIEGAKKPFVVRTLATIRNVLQRNTVEIS